MREPNNWWNNGSHKEQIEKEQEQTQENEQEQCTLKEYVSIYRVAQKSKPLPNDQHN